ARICLHSTARTSSVCTTQTMDAMATFTINGAARSFDGDPDMPLLWDLRDELGLTGTKFGCGGGFCGACTVHVDGQAMRSCQLPMEQVSGRKVVTIEGLSADQSH